MKRKLIAGAPDKDPAGGDGGLLGYRGRDCTAGRFRIRIIQVPLEKPIANDNCCAPGAQGGTVEACTALERSARNKTLQVPLPEAGMLETLELDWSEAVAAGALRDRIVCTDTFAALPHLPAHFVDLLILDPPYNLTKNYNGTVFRERSGEAYREWFARLLDLVKPTLKPDASVYVCADWQTSLLVAPLLQQHFYLRNRITWARDKGRGAATNWKAAGEDIWFCTVGTQFHFDVSAVKLRKRIRAPYRSGGRPKDWGEDSGGRFRLTHPSNVWTDLTVPFWSMAENTEHPTQKPEKMVARLVLASSRPGDLVFDPFLGSGTTAVVAKKLGRAYLGMEAELGYCRLSTERVRLAAEGMPIQGYRGGVFWERNS
jgi:site-specific DNA-methyltransferase (adenine-specific)